MDFQIEGQRLYLDGSPVSMFSGSFQYWRIEPDLWAEIMQKVRGMGFGMIETYMPWSVHEVSRGQFDFGTSDENRNLPRFLEECSRAGLRVLARPGPHINAEMTYFGYPERIFSDDEILSRAADGSPVYLPAPPRMFPVPCYHHPRFLSEVRSYFSALAAEIKEMVHPKGPIIAFQADNECSKFFRVHPFDHDYSEYSVRLYRRFLAEKYGSLGELNRAWRAGVKAWGLIDPPRRFRASKSDELPSCLDWVEFGEYYINESLRNIAGILRDVFGGGIPLFHNYPTVMPLPPFDLAGAEEFLDFQGVDMYPQKRQYHAMRAGMKYTSEMSRLPVLVEFSSGGIYYAQPVGLDDQRFTTWTAVMHGIKGINFYMLVERERWYGSPVKRDGSLRPDRYEFYGRFLSELERWGLEDMTQHRPVLMLINREYERLAAAAVLLCPNSTLLHELSGTVEKPADLFISTECFGLSEPVASRYARLRTFWYWALSAAGVHFAVGDSLSTAGLDDHPLAILPTFEFLSAALQEKLLEYVRGGGTLVVGPRAPRLDETMAPFELLGKNLREPVEVRRGGEVFGVPVDEVSLFSPEAGGEAGELMLYRQTIEKGSIIQLGLVPGEVCDIEGAEPFRPLVDTLLRLAGVGPSFVPEDSRVDVSLFAGGQKELVMVANPTEESISTDISHAGEGPYRDLRTGEELGGGTIRLSIEPYSIRVLGRS